MRASYRTAIVTLCVDFSSPCRESTRGGGVLGSCRFCGFWRGTYGGLIGRVLVGGLFRGSGDFIGFILGRDGSRVWISWNPSGIIFGTILTDSIFYVSYPLWWSPHTSPPTP